MTKQRNPQAEQMADESMIRNLAAQAQAIWPQEQALFARYELPAQSRIADIGCGSGEITARLAARYPQAQLLGIDILESSVAYARRNYAALGARVRFEQGDAFELQQPADHFDLVVCRHVTQAVPEPEKVLAELKRICRPGGWLHVLSEDYGMLHMIPGELDPDYFWQQGPILFAHNTGTDARIGRRTYTLMKRLSITDLRVDYATVDTLRVPRATFAAIIEAWRDGYADAISAKTSLRPQEARALFDYIIASILNPELYAVWQVPIISGRKPGQKKAPRAGEAESRRQERTTMGSGGTAKPYAGAKTNGISSIS